MGFSEKPVRVIVSTFLIFMFVVAVFKMAARFFDVSRSEIYQ